MAAMIRVDELLGKHFAILGTTGTGKSCTTALILRSILQRNPAAHVLLLDPHNEYASSFGEWGEVISPRNMQLPYWLLTFEELIEVLIGARARRPSRWCARKPTATFRPIRASASNPASGPSPKSPRKGANTGPRCASSRSGRPRSIPPSSRNATPCLRCACRMTATRKSSNRRSPTRAPACSNFSPPSGSARPLPSSDGVTLPVRIKFDELPAHAMPKSSGARFSEMWQKSVGDEGFLDSIVDRWRNASAAVADAVQGAALFAESVNLLPHPVEAMLPAPPAFEERRTPARETPPERREFGTLRREPNAAGAQPTQAGMAVRAIREKLHHR